MNKYTIYCTEEQTKKARELGAPIKATSFPTPNRVDYDDCYVEYKGYYLEIPTAEQMIGWLEKQGILVDVSSAFNHTNVKIYGYRIGFGFNDYVSDAVDYPTRKEATLAAIDAALDYLKEKQEVIMKDKSTYWKVRKAFCKAICPNGCPQLKDDIEGGGGLVVSCDKYNRFINELKKL